MAPVDRPLWICRTSVTPVPLGSRIKRDGTHDAACLAAPLQVEQDGATHIPFLGATRRRGWQSPCPGTDGWKRAPEVAKEPTNTPRHEWPCWQLTGNLCNQYSISWDWHARCARPAPRTWASQPLRAFVLLSLDESLRSRLGRGGAWAPPGVPVALSHERQNPGDACARPGCCGFGPPDALEPCRARRGTHLGRGCQCSVMTARYSPTSLSP